MLDASAFTGTDGTQERCLLQDSETPQFSWLLMPDVIACEVAVPAAFCHALMFACYQIHHLNV